MSRKKKSLFKKKRTSPLAVAMVVFIFVLVAFVAISVAKPLIDRFSSEKPDPTPSVGDELPESADPVTEATAPPTEETTQPTTVTDPPVVKQGIYYLSFSEGDMLSQLVDAVNNAVADDCKGICVELMCVGGKLNYLTSNETAISAEAIASNAVSLEDMLLVINDAELIPYARISALSDNVASWYDRSICYLFEDGTSKWLDNALDKGGKPWISPFREGAKEYISSIVTEISDAGFAGIVAGEFDFPPFRTKDLGYVGEIVKSPTRYTALTDFSNLLQDTLGSAKTYAVEVSAYDILAGECELLTDPALLNSTVIYVKYDSAQIGSRIVKSDDSIISFDGLSEAQKLTQVYRLVNTALASSGKRVIPSLAVEPPREEIFSALADVGYKPDDLIIY